MMLEHADADFSNSGNNDARSNVLPPAKRPAEENLPEQFGIYNKKGTIAAPDEGPSFCHLKSGNNEETEAEDRVVREIDVYLCPPVDQDTKLYLLQYPLRPSWRPYDLDDRRLRVRVKPKHMKLEVDLDIDKESKNYDCDSDYPESFTQTLASSSMHLSTSYAVGILQNDKLYMNPLHAIVQLRPVMKHMNIEPDKQMHAEGGDDEIPNTADNEDEVKKGKDKLVPLTVAIKRRETEWQEKTRLQSYAHIKKQEESESWINFEPYGIGSPLSSAIRLKMVSPPNVQLFFGLDRNGYLSTFLPARRNLNFSLSKSSLDPVFLEKKLEWILTQGPSHIIKFDKLMKLVPASCSEQNVLDVLVKKALLVQGCWAAASFLCYTGEVRAIRDYLLFLFWKNRTVTHAQLKGLKVSKEILTRVLAPVATYKEPGDGWEFIESTDGSFIKRHPCIVKQQSQQWLAAEEDIKNAAFSLECRGIDYLVEKPSGPSNNLLPVRLNQRETLAIRSAACTTLSNEVREALPGILRQIFMKHPVCTLPFIIQSLREFAIVKAQDASSKEVAIAVAAAHAASAAFAEVKSMINQIASNIDDHYFLASLGDPSVDPFRKVVIALLRAKGASTGLKRSEIMEASKIALKAQVSTAIYQKVMKELCYTRGACWVLKAGDGRDI